MKAINVKEHSKEIISVFENVYYSAAEAAYKVFGLNASIEKKLLVPNFYNIYLKNPLSITGYDYLTSKNSLNRLIGTLVHNDYYTQKIMFKITENEIDVYVTHWNWKEEEEEHNDVIDELINLVEKQGDSGCSIWRSNEDKTRFCEIIEKLREYKELYDQIEQEFNQSEKNI